MVTPPRGIALDDADEKREQRGRGATCAHRPADEAKPNEDQKPCDGGGRSNHLVAPPRVIAFDDTDEKREGPCHFQDQRPGTKRPRKGVGVDDAVDCPVEVPAWLMGLCGFLGDLPCWIPRRPINHAGTEPGSPPHHLHPKAKAWRVLLYA